ncbi:315_t:CDS:2 [Cetraspora pellucida]|uniref:315_t:CDS:1 n=1 Tax=Cetraspora pellucida TaxID=1433469 RepID=A0A9N9DRD4_9GLOM|nr:315_t:CDS:2 [Cetraspora pellucida]
MWNEIRLKLQKMTKTAKELVEEWSDYSDCPHQHHEKRISWLEIGIEKNFIKLFDYNSFENWKLIGRGGFGTVYSAYSNDIKNTMVLKSLHVNDSKNLLYLFDGFIRE